MSYTAQCLWLRSRIETRRRRKTLFISKIITLKLCPFLRETKKKQVLAIDLHSTSYSQTQ